MTLRPAAAATAPAAPRTTRSSWSWSPDASGEMPEVRASEVARPPLQTRRIHRVEGAGLLRYLRFGSMQPFRPTGPGEETVMIAEAYRKGKAPEAGFSLPEEFRN